MWNSVKNKLQVIACVDCVSLDFEYDCRPLTIPKPSETMTGLVHIAKMLWPTVELVVCFAHMCPAKVTIAAPSQQTVTKLATAIAAHYFARIALTSRPITSSLNANVQLLNVCVQREEKDSNFCGMKGDIRACSIKSSAFESFAFKVELEKHPNPWDFLAISAWYVELEGFESSSLTLYGQSGPGSRISNRETYSSSILALQFWTTKDFVTSQEM